MKLMSGHRSFPDLERDWILRPELHRHGLHYEWSALLNSATEESDKVALPRGLAPRASAFAERRAELLHFGSMKLNESKWICAMPVPPRRLQFGRLLCSLLHQ
jgi:hypothetical protein